jgi:acyl-CoA thioester hydrolase
MAERPARLSRAGFSYFRPIATRWMDNDVYGHVNNVVYYAYFDTVVNGHLIDNGLLDIAASPAIGLVVETGCTYFESVAFPDALEAGLAVETLGQSSVRYRVAIFKTGAESAAAQGHFVHVYVDRESQTPVAIPEAHRRAFEALTITPAGRSAPG